LVITDFKHSQNVSVLARECPVFFSYAKLPNLIGVGIALFKVYTSVVAFFEFMKCFQKVFNKPMPFQV